MVYLAIILCAMLTEGDVALQKIFRSKTSHIHSSAEVYVVVMGILGMSFYFAMAGGKVPLNTTTLLFSLAYAVVCLSYLFVSVISFDYVDLVYKMLFSGAGGMVVPFLFEVFVGNEKTELIQVIAILVRLSAILLPFVCSEKTSFKKKGGWLICLLLFLNAGIPSILSKLYVSSPGALGNANYCFWTNVFMFPIMVAMAVFKSGFANLKNDIRAVPKHCYLYIIGVAALGNCATLIGLYCLERLSVTVYTLVSTPLSMLFTLLISAIFFKEKQNYLSYICIALSAVAAVLYVM